MVNKKGFSIQDDIFDEALGDVKEVEHSLSARPKRSFCMIVIADIIEHSPNQKRLITFDPDKIPEDAELLESVKVHGVLEPIIVKRLPGQLGAAAKYLLVAGHRRCSAAQDAGHEYIPALIITNEDNVSILTLVENTGTRKLTSYELAMSIKQIANENPDWDTKTIIAKTGIPQSTVYNLLSILNDNCPAIMDLLKRGVGSRKILELKHVFSKIDIENNQNEFAGLLDESMSFNQIKSIRAKVDSGVDPFIAFQLTVGSTNTDVSPSSIEIKKEVITTVIEEKAKEDKEPGLKNHEDNFNGSKLDPRSKVALSEKTKIVKIDSLPDIDNKHAITSLAHINGLSFLETKNLLITANENGNGFSMQEFSFACMFVKVGKEINKALEIARVVSGNNKISKLLLSHHDLCIQTISFLENDNQDKELNDLLEKIILGEKDA